MGGKSWYPPLKWSHSTRARSAARSRSFSAFRHSGHNPLASPAAIKPRWTSQPILAAYFFNASLAICCAYFGTFFSSKDPIRRSAVRSRSFSARNLSRSATISTWSLKSNTERPLFWFSEWLDYPVRSIHQMEFGPLRRLLCRFEGAPKPVSTFYRVHCIIPSPS